jgi:hypothetical protein
MHHKHLVVQAEGRISPTFPELVIALPAAAGTHDEATLLPGTLQIEVLEGTGIPVLSPLPSPDSALVIDNNSGGQMAVDAATSIGSIRVVVPGGGTVGIARTTPGVAAKLRISVEEQVRMYIHPSGSGLGHIPGHWIILRRRINVAGDGGPADATAVPGEGRHSIDLKGTFD